MERLKIGKREIGIDLPPYFIADIAANHDGDLNRALALIELAKESGADAAKFQNFKAETIISRNGFESIGARLSHQKSWDKPVFEVYKDASISDEWTPRLKEKCKAVDIEYMTSPYDFASVDLADKYSDCFKIGSGDITWVEILEYIAKKSKPVLIATGASEMADVRRAVEAITKHNHQIVLMQCNTNYTADKSNFRNINLNVLKTYQAAYPGIITGLSDHTYGHETVLGAVAIGARVIEKHFTDDNSRVGPDHKFSMSPETWRQMSVATENLFYALGDGIKKIEENEKDTSLVQRRSLYYTRNIKAGEELGLSDIFPLRPVLEGSIPPYRLNEIVGKILAKGVNVDTAAKWEDFK